MAEGKIYGMIRDDNKSQEIELNFVLPIKDMRLIEKN
jgi:hypothetical protein